jgi:transmembrane sensor
MKPGEMAVFDKQANKIKQVEGILSHSYGWLDNKLYMEDMPLSVVCKYLERWYDVKIMLQPGLGENIRYNGVIQEETVTDVMNALSRLSKIRYHVTGKNISITSK